MEPAQCNIGTCIYESGRWKFIKVFVLQLVVHIY